MEGSGDDEQLAASSSSSDTLPEPLQDDGGPSAPPQADSGNATSLEVASETATSDVFAPTAPELAPLTGDGPAAEDLPGSTATSPSASQSPTPPLEASTIPIDVDVDAVLESAPEIFFCPISTEIMRDPVLLMTGQTYEREAIEKYVAPPPRWRSEHHHIPSP